MRRYRRLQQVIALMLILYSPVGTVAHAINESIFLLGLFWVHSPFQPPRSTWRAMLFALPVFGDALFAIIRLFSRGT